MELSDKYLILLNKIKVNERNYCRQRLYKNGMDLD